MMLATRRDSAWRIRALENVTPTDPLTGALVPRVPA
jgi:hypothetical protein